ncbi:sigma 54-interacting transcriptional regulator [Rhodoferax sp. GW822-FHT02A01]|uniref:sigma-54 interaction domain-containing protein n=1 Tax=Rhodoferax sp. GW822-FHT02A01 TaxID=3141537 RepID=UPI00315DF889
MQVATDSLLGHIATMCEGALIVDKDARIVWMNERYPHRLGITDLAGTIGKPVEQILPNSLMRTVVETGRPIMLDIMEFGSESFVVVRLPLRDGDHNIIGAIGIILLDNALGLAPLVGRYNRLRQDYSDAQNKLALARRAKYTLGSIVGGSPACIQLKLQARRAARSNAAVLIQGETGTGKELLAQAIHNASDRASKPFVAVNIAAIPANLLESEFFGHAAGAFTGADRKGREGKFKMANGGTLFLDEIGDMSAAVQAKLLRVLQEGEFEALGSNRLETVDVRIVAATSCDLQVEMAAGRFRPDLFYRLNVVSLHVPPLRERTSDLPALCEHLLDSLTQKLRLPPREITPDALNRLAQHAWPGNVRELSNILERVLLMSDADTITLEAVNAVLPAAAPNPAEPVAAAAFTLTDTLRNAEKIAIAQALLACAGNRTRAAQQLGISRTSLYEKVTLHGLS